MDAGRGGVQRQLPRWGRQAVILPFFPKKCMETRKSSLRVSKRHTSRRIASPGGGVPTLAEGVTYLDQGVPTLARGYLPWPGGTYLGWGIPTKVGNPLRCRQTRAVTKRNCTRGTRPLHSRLRSANGEFLGLCDVQTVSLRKAESRLEIFPYFLQLSLVIFVCHEAN